MVVKSSQQSNKRDRPHGDGGSGSDTSSLEESVEDHKQPQTEEIMNAELIQVKQLVINFWIFLYLIVLRWQGSSERHNQKTVQVATSTNLPAPKIVKTTTKQTMVQNAEGVRHNKEEKVEDLTPGGTGAITVVSSTNKVLNLFKLILIPFGFPR